MNTRVKLAAAVAVTGTLVVVASAVGLGSRQVRGNLDGYEEVPAVSTVANGKFRATITPSSDGFSYTLNYAGLEGDVAQAHIHFGQRSVNGGISVFLCSNLGNGPAGTQACPPSPATVTGTIDAADVIGPTAQGIAPGELGELIRAMRAGMTYANVHTSKFGGGEIRAQLVTSFR